MLAMLNYQEKLRNVIVNIVSKVKLPTETEFF